jgi:hypothetical protein
MLIRESDDDEELDREKEVKVKIPVNYHIKLHSMKVLTGKQISKAVTEALGEYFERLRDADDPDAVAEELEAG